MALTLVATAGSDSANTYITLADAITYFEGRPGADAWDAATDDEQKAALVMATARLDQEQYRGSRASATQALAWPRTDVTVDGITLDASTIPTRIARATCEEALAILADPSRYDGLGLDAFSAVQAGPVTLTLREGAAPEQALAPMAARLLGPVRIGGSGSFRMVRA